MKASSDALRQALRSADTQSLDLAVSLFAYFMNGRPHLFPESKMHHDKVCWCERLLEPQDGDVVFNHRLDLVRTAAGL